MIIATVTTCPQRWSQYRRLRAEFRALDVGIQLRTFQSAERLGEPRVNNNINARAALAYCAKHLKDIENDWVLYLEDDVLLRPALGDFLAAPDQTLREADCWYLCNRKVNFRTQFSGGHLVLNELTYPVQGTHALLLAGRYLRPLLDVTWADYADTVTFNVLEALRARILQVVRPVLAIHDGEYSTFAPHRRAQSETNHANTCHHN